MLILNLSQSSASLWLMFPLTPRLVILLNNYYNYVWYFYFLWNEIHTSTVQLLSMGKFIIPVTTSHGSDIMFGQVAA